MTESNRAMDGETLKAHSDLNRARTDIATNRHKLVIDRLLGEINGMLNPDGNGEDSQKNNDLMGFYRFIEETISIAKELPGNSDKDIETHIEATERLRSKIPAIKDLLRRNKHRSNSIEYLKLSECAIKAHEWRHQALNSLLCFPEARICRFKNLKPPDMAGISPHIQEVKKYLNYAGRYNQSDIRLRKLAAELLEMESGVESMTDIRGR